MPQVPSTSPATGQPVHPAYIHTTALNFVDNAGRTLLLRGVNLSGASKAPVGHPSYILEDFWDSAEAGGESFVGRPLNIDDGSADVHLARLRGWGFNLLRFPFTWEALEHEGPGKYDYEFMDYTIRVLCKCRDYGFRVFMDPHQDTWSRFSGGSGAPYWTLAACGINPRNITATQAAILHCEYPLGQEPDPASLPAMVWSTNYGRLLSQTVFTLFFAGRDFAPNAIIDGMNIQDYLQSHFIEACGRLVDRIREFDDGSLFEECIIGWDSLNEPFEGLCGWEDLNFNPEKQGSTLKKGTYPTPAQSLRLGMGQAQTVDNWSFGAMGPAKNGSVTIDPKGRKLWADAKAPPSQEGEASMQDELPDGTHPRWGWKRDVSKWPLGTCIWAQHGVWDVETGFVLRPDYFRFRPAGPDDDMVEVEAISDYWKPHWLEYAQRVRRSHPEAIVFVQPPVFSYPPRMDDEELKGRCVYAPHYYDGLTLITRHWNWFNADALGLLRGKYSSTLQAVKIGEGAIRRSLHQQLGYLQDDVALLGSAPSSSSCPYPPPPQSSQSQPQPAPWQGRYPTLIGEIGTPFDMDDKKSYGWTDGGKHKGDFGAQEKALDASLNACDGTRPLNWTVWTYVPDDHTHEWGDGWNMEDLSLWSWDDLEEGEEEEGGDYKDEDALNSRAALLKEGQRGEVQEQDGGSRESRTRRKQPFRSLPMVAASSSLSLATLGAASVTLPNSTAQSRARSISLASTSSSSSSTSRRARRFGPSSPYADVEGHSPNPYTFLTDGARAVRAFARPWPVKVVGKPLDVKFDIGKAVFKLVVQVDEDDAYPAWRGGARRGSKRDEVHVEDVNLEEEERATEVYLPLVHYAHKALLEDADARWACEVQEKRSLRRRKSTRSIASMSTGTLLAGATPQIPGQVLAYLNGAKEEDSGDERRGRSLARNTPTPTATSTTAATATPPPMLETETDAYTIVEVDRPESRMTGVSRQKLKNRDRESDATAVSSKAPSISGGKVGFPGAAICPASGSGAAPLLIADTYTPAFTPPSSSTPSLNNADADRQSNGSAVPLLDVEIKVSTGHFRLEGQKLLWWYEVPKAGEPAREYTLEVRRRGGALPSPEKRRKDRRERRERERTSGKGGAGEQGWCKQLCPEEGPGCVVM